jgi:transposase
MHHIAARVLALRAYERLKSFRRVQDLLGVSKSSIQRWHKATPSQQLQRTARKMHSTALRAIQSAIDRNGFITAEALRSHVQAHLHLKLSSSCIRFWMRRLGYTRKKAQRVVTRPDLAEKRELFARERQRDWNTDNVVSIDESAIYFDMRPSYGYARRSQRLAVAKHAAARCRWSLLMAVSNDRVLGWKLIKGSVTSLVFADFVSTLDMGGRDTLFMDNASIHKTLAVRSALNDRGIKPVFVPPYTPQFQPIEHCFAVVKHAYRRSCAEDPPPHQSTTDQVATLGATAMLESARLRIEGCIQRLTSTMLGNMFDACWRRSS